MINWPIFTEFKNNYCAIQYYETLTNSNRHIYIWKLQVLCKLVNLQLFVGGLTSYLRYFCLLAYSGVQHILCCDFFYLYVALVYNIVVMKTYFGYISINFHEGISPLLPPPPPSYTQLNTGTSLCLSQGMRWTAIRLSHYQCCVRTFGWLFLVSALLAMLAVTPVEFEA